MTHENEYFCSIFFSVITFFELKQVFLYQDVMEVYSIFKDNFFGLSLNIYKICIIPQCFYFCVQESSEDSEFGEEEDMDLFITKPKPKSKKKALLQQVR